MSKTRINIPHDLEVLPNELPRKFGPKEQNGKVSLQGFLAERVGFEEEYRMLDVFKALEEEGVKSDSYQEFKQGIKKKFGIDVTKKGKFVDGIENLLRRSPDKFRDYIDEQDGAEEVLERIGKVGKIDALDYFQKEAAPDEYFELDYDGPPAGDKGVLQFHDDHALENAEKLIGKHFSSGDDKKILQEFKDRYKEIEESGNKDEDGVEYDDNNKPGDAEPVAKFSKSAYLSSSLDVLKRLNEEQKKLDKLQKLLEEVKRAKDPEKAGQMDLPKMVEERFEEKKGDDYIPQLYTPASNRQEASLQVATKAAEGNIASLKKTFRRIIDPNNKDLLVPKKDFDASKKSNPLLINGHHAAGAVKDVMNSLVTRGLLTSSNATKDQRWEEFGKFRNELLASVLNHPNLNSSIAAQIKRIQKEQKDGLLTQAEFDALYEEIKKSAENADEKHKEYLAGLQKAVNDINEDLLKNISADLKESDNLHIHRIVQLVLFCSPFLPIPIAATFFNIFEPFLSGALDMPSYLSSIFSTDGPFGKLAWLTDKMELDKLTKIIFGDVLGGPTAVVQSVLQNDITTPIASTVGAGFSNSPLAPFAMMSWYNAFQKNHIGRDFDRMVKYADTLGNSKKSLRDKAEQIMKAERGRLDIEGNDFSKKEVEIRNNLFAALNMADHLQSSYNENSQACEDLLNKIFGKDSEEAKKLIEALKKKDQDALAKAFHKGLKNDKYKSVVEAIYPEKYDAVRENLESQFYFEEADERGINHDYLPEKGASLTKNEILERFVENGAKDAWIYGKEFADFVEKQQESGATKESLIEAIKALPNSADIAEQMILAEFLRETNSQDVFTKIEQRQGDENFDLKMFLFGEGNFNAQALKEIFEGYPEYKRAKETKSIIFQYLIDEEKKPVDNALQYLEDLESKNVDSLDEEDLPKPGEEDENLLELKLNKIKEKYKDKKAPAVDHLKQKIGETYRDFIHPEARTLKEKPKVEEKKEPEKKSGEEKDDDEEREDDEIEEKKEEKKGDASLSNKSSSPSPSPSPISAASIKSQIKQAIR
ncbi:MAG: hypothetical protein K0R25_294 [Rickettsiaceae bacterium]|jgi:hypothetical protein|nr:hypothetical protein [Rickettsiaceae bacterium]